MRQTTARPRPTSRARATLAWSIAIALAACAGGPDGKWVGTLHTEAGTCPDQGPSDLSIGRGTVQFVPGDGVLALSGKVDPAKPDTLHAQLLGTDMSHHPLPMVFEGTVADDTVTGTYGTPTCRATITMHRPTLSLLQRIDGR